MFKVLMALALAGISASAWSAEKSVTLSIPSMDCAACPITVKQALTKVDGIKAVSSNLAKRQTKVTFDDAKVTPALITQTTRNAGFPATIARQ
jgi:periplasmic mercuric ion binding protein